ncbi:MAG: glycosyltransferase family 39 protein [bacterium]
MTRRSDISPWNSTPALWMAGFTLLFHLPVLITGGYGIFRDEMYYVACANHLAWGYVDQPPLSIFILWVWKGIFSNSLFSLRLLATLAGSASVFIGVRITALLGGGRFGQMIAGLALIMAPQLMALRFYYSMNVFDLLFWNLVVYQFLVLLHTGERRVWVTIGVLLGLTLLNKISGLWLAAGIGIGTLASSRRRDLLTHWPWSGVAVALVLFSPYLIWELAHGWPTLEFMHNATTQKLAVVGPITFLREEIINMNPFIAPLWLLGTIVLFTQNRFRLVRAIAWVFPVVLLILLISGSAKPYYLAPAFTLPLGAGAVFVEEMTRRVRKSLSVQLAVIAFIAVPGLLLAPIAIPVLPVKDYIRYSARIGLTPSVGERWETAELHQFYADMFGWKGLARTVATVYNDLPEAGSGKVMISGQNYGQAGAIDYFGKSLDLPPASSLHNNYWYWGPQPADPKVAIFIVQDGSYLSGLFKETTLAAVHRCNLCMPYESRLEIWICRKPKIDLHDWWPKHRAFI